MARCCPRRKGLGARLPVLARLLHRWRTMSSGSSAEQPSPPVGQGLGSQRARGSDSIRSPSAPPHSCRRPPRCGTRRPRPPRHRRSGSVPGVPRPRTAPRRRRARRGRRPAAPSSIAAPARPPVASRRPPGGARVSASPLNPRGGGAPRVVAPAEGRFSRRRSSGWSNRPRVVLSQHSAANAGSRSASSTAAATAAIDGWPRAATAPVPCAYRAAAKPAGHPQRGQIGRQRQLAYFESPLASGRARELARIERITARCGTSRARQAPRGARSSPGRDLTQNILVERAKREAAHALPWHPEEVAPRRRDFGLSVANRRTARPQAPEANRRADSEASSSHCASSIASTPAPVEP